MKNLSRRLTVGFVAAIIIIIAGVAAYMHGIRKVDPEQLEKSIQQRLPTGTDKRDVIEFLASHNISHSDFIPDVRVIYCYIPNSKTGFINANIHVTFVFDENGKVASHAIQELYGWP